MDTMIYVMIGFCLILQAIILVLVGRKRARTADMGTSLDRLESTLFKLIGELKQQSR